MKNAALAEWLNASGRDNSDIRNNPSEVRANLSSGPKSSNPLRSLPRVEA